MVSSIYGNSGQHFDARVADRAYQKTHTSGNTNGKDSAKVKGAAGTEDNTRALNGADGKVKTTEWKKLSANSPLVPTAKDGYGTVIGNVELSDKAKEYYNKLKAKYHNMDFILVGKAEKSRVAANASAYGNASKPVVLIDEEKLELMASDENFRKKYEGIIEQAIPQLQSMKNSLASSGAAVKNFGMSVDSNGKTSFFATLENASKEQNRILEKRRVGKKAEKIKEKKISEKKENAERIRNLREKNRVKYDPEEEQAYPYDGKESEETDNTEYIDLWADSVEDLARTVSVYAYERLEADNVREENEHLGGNIDFRG